MLVLFNLFGKQTNIKQSITQRTVVQKISIPAHFVSIMTMSKLCLPVPLPCKVKNGQPYSPNHIILKQKPFIKPVHIEGTDMDNCF